jgi:hypothetical protein
MHEIILRLIKILICGTHDIIYWENNIIYWENILYKDGQTFNICLIITSLLGIFFVTSPKPKVSKHVYFSQESLQNKTTFAGFLRGVIILV